MATEVIVSRTREGDGGGENLPIVATPSLESSVGFRTQFTATVRRQLLQKARMPVAWAVEIALPLFFVLMVMILAAAGSKEDHPKAQFVGVNNSVIALNGELRSSLCLTNASISNVSGLGAIVGFCPFSADSVPAGVRCMSEEVFAIIPADARSLCVTSQSIYDVLYANTGGFKHQIGLLGFDDMVLLQLMTRVLHGGPPVSMFVSSSLVSSLRISGKLYFVPASEGVARVVSTLRGKHSLFDSVYGGTYGSLSDVNRMVPEGETWGIISVEEPSNGVSLVISLNASAVPSADTLRPTYGQGGLDAISYSQYWASGFLTLQQTLYDAILDNNTISASAASDTPVFDKSIIGLVPMGYSQYTTNTFLTVAGKLAPFVLVLAYLYPVSQVAKRFVEEKELRLREGTMIMGLGKAAFFTSWLAIYHIQSILVSLVSAILLKATVMPGSDFFLIFLAFALFSIGTVHLSAMLATFFNSSKVTALVVPMLYFAMAIPSFTGSVNGLVALLCPVPFAVALELLFGYEINDGMGWGDITSSSDSPMNMGTALGFFILDIVLYTVLMLYFDVVLPKQWGATLHPCFCIKALFNRGGNQVVDSLDEEMASTSPDAPARPWLSRTSHLVLRQINSDRASGHSSTTRRHADEIVVDSVQDYPQPLDQASVHIKRLKKEFQLPKRKHVAVNKFDLALFPNSITVLLGHNGAGKTTVMNMITGMLNITSGDVMVYGDSVRSNLGAVRRKVGYCPQHNILWDDLTCIEHLEYFGRLKGMSGVALSKEVEHLLREVDLWEKANNRSHELSGGQKRKLSVAIAFMGGSKLVLLDEPTAGMDVGARRHTWELLKEMSSKNNRTVLLTTHFMDEADLLGSRIAIMSKGELESYGTSTFLKNKLGTGYVLKVASTEAITSPDGIMSEVLKAVPTAEVKECKGQELTVSLPKSHIREFAGMIRALESDAMRQSQKISSISMSVSTLEDVFVQLAIDEEHRDAEAERVALGETTSVTVDDSKAWLGALERAYSKQLLRSSRATTSAASAAAFLRQLGGLLMKRINHAKRDNRTLFLQVGLPLIVIILAMILGLSSTSDPTRITFENGMYKEPQMVDLSGCDSTVAALMHYDKVAITNTSTYDFSIDLMNTAKEHGGYERFGAVACNKAGTVVGTRGTLIPNSTSTFTSLLINGSAYHQAPLLLNQLYAASIRKVRGDFNIPVTLSAQAMPQTSRQEAMVESISTISITILILIPFTFIPSTYVGYAVKEKETKSKHLQFVSGVHYLAYWLANFIFDSVCFLVTMTVTLIVFAIFGRDEFVGGAETFFATFMLLLFYGISGITSAYAISFLFNVSSTAQNMVMFGNFISGFMLVLVVYILSAISESGKSVTDVLKWFFRFIPSYCLGDGLMALSSAKSSYDISHVRKNLFGTGVIGSDLLYMGFLSVGYFALVLLIDNPNFNSIVSRLMFWRAAADEDGFVEMREEPNAELDLEERRLVLEGEDEDVTRERQEIRSGMRADDAVKVNRLRKVYSNGKVAVRSLTFGVRKGEVFGFLGTNGAGKTTTMSMLTGEFPPTSGTATVGRYNVVESASEAQKIIGYCPQFDAVMELMTPFEHLTLYAALRLVPAGQETAELIEALLAACDLLKFRDVPSGNLSGGNRRKLSIAISLIGGPQVVFLDEPSAGIDPAARRQLFDVISFVATRSAVVLTTHHLEEVDVLAHRVGIMDRGALKCIGSLERLKNKYGSGVEVTLQVSNETSTVAGNVAKAKSFMESTFPHSKLSEEQHQRLLYVLPFNSVKLSDLFESIMNAVDSGEHGIKDYTVQQSSLEQVFLRISQLQGDVQESEDTAASSLALVVDNYNSGNRPSKGSQRLKGADALAELYAV